MCIYESCRKLDCLAHIACHFCSDPFVLRSTRGICSDVRLPLVGLRVGADQGALVPWTCALCDLPNIGEKRWPDALELEHDQGSNCEVGVGPFLERRARGRIGKAHGNHQEGGSSHREARALRTEALANALAIFMAIWAQHGPSEARAACERLCEFHGDLGATWAR